MPDDPHLPPLLAHETFVRVVGIARFDGLSILGVAGGFALLAAAAGDFHGAAIGLTIAAAGAGELHGVGLLRHGEPSGVNWLIHSQIFLLVAMLSYCAFQLTHVDLRPVREAFHATLNLPSMKQSWAQAQSMGMTEDQFLRQTYSLAYIVVAAVTLVYQGGLAIYYARRRDAIRRALADE